MIELGKQRFDALTSLRFFAAAMIVMHHAATIGLGPGWPGQLALAQGVSFFFVLSGFVLAYNYPQLDSAASIRHFYVARIAKIWPSHIVSTILFWIFVASVGYAGGLITLAYVTLTHGWVPLVPFITVYNTVSWTISTEFFFYLAFPILIHNWRTTWRLKMTATFALAAVMWLLAVQVARQPLWGIDAGGLSYINPLARIVEFTLGIWLCDLYRRVGPGIAARMSRSQATIVEAGIVAISILSLWLSHQVAYSAIIQKSMGFAHMLFLTSGFGTFVFTGTIFVFALGRGALSSLLKKRPMVFLGEISFALYLVHTLFLVYMRAVPRISIEFSGNTIYVIYWCVALALATLLHLWIELPFQRIIRQWHSGARFSTLLSLGEPAGWFTVAILTMYLVQPSIRETYPPTVVAGGVNMLRAPVRFDSTYRLDGMEVEYPPASAPILRFSWTAEANAPLNKMVAVHLLDSSGTLVQQRDFVMDTGFRSALGGDGWSNVITIANLDLGSFDAIGIAVYDTSSGISTIAGDPRTTTDWAGKRLLVKLREHSPSGVSASRRIPAADNEVALILTPSDLEGVWSVGSGIGFGKIELSSPVLMVTAESGTTAAASILGNRLEVPAWGIYGRLTSDGKQLHWSNGLVWLRRDGGITATPRDPTAATVR